MNQITIDNILLVDVPVDFELKELTKWTLYYKSKGRESCVGLSPGNWQFIGTTDFVSKEMAEQIVECFRFEAGKIVEGKPTHFPNYEKPFSSGPDVYYYTALESYQSWLRTNKIPSDKRFAILKQAV